MSMVPDIVMSGASIETRRSLIVRVSPLCSSEPGVSTWPMLSAADFQFSQTSAPVTSACAIPDRTKSMAVVVPRDFHCVIVRSRKKNQYGPASSLRAVRSRRDLIGKPPVVAIAVRKTGGFRMDMQGKTVLITGASRGIGAAAARAFAGPVRRWRWLPAAGCDRRPGRRDRRQRHRDPLRCQPLLGSARRRSRPASAPLAVSTC